MDHIQGVPHRSTETIESVNHDHITALGISQQRTQPGPVRGGTELLVHIDPLGRNADLAQRVDLPVKIPLAR
jgi:hypothetical protein